MHNFDDKINHIHPHELVKKMTTETVNVIDIREPFELKELPFEGARNIPMNILIMFHSEFLNTDETYYILCHHGQRSYTVTEFLQEYGYKVINVLGGVDLVN
ncbi:rhodanese-like domain-containing protein [Candidatus Xianfuyuplasma coldseepsis]|uniref:Rhodanese-like domain-containing protein n=1 Tax=Candidatus Xianfuyuplasma coldseepsis TaxID=2782163 RepID=A0A7L7KSK5_9MOLU|nr:rhodanese-like domain-containing protein [Xianfuyuplasma coldseepsis]QMS85723.1 rhodanese-like domain-containing protein [Xianfuyuplasma coldseepsis]